MSAETKPLKLMPHTTRVGISGRMEVEPGARSQFTLPNEFRALFTAASQGASLSKLVDQIDPKQSGPRFKLIKKFLIFLEEHDMLADRDYIRLAESLNTEYSWPTSILSTEIIDIRVSKVGRSKASAVLSFVMSLLSFVGALVSLAVLIRPPAYEAEPSLIRALVLFIGTYVLSRNVSSLWQWMILRFGGLNPKTDLVLEPICLRLRVDPSGKPVKRIFAMAASLLFPFGVAFVVAHAFAQAQLEFYLTILAGAFAFFMDASPYSKSTLTNLLKSLYATFSDRTGGRESAIRRAHVTSSLAWTLFLGLCIVIDVWPTMTSTWRALKTESSTPRLAGYVIIALLALFVLNWLADIIGSVSYEDASAGTVRKIWRKRSDSELDRVQGGLPPNAQDLERLPFLRQIPIEIRKPLLLMAQVRAFKEGQGICRQGDQDRNLFVVLEGRLAVVKKAAIAGGQSSRKVVAWLDPGAVFGENSFFFGQTRTADVVGMDAGRVLVVPHSKEMKLVDAEKSEELRTRIWFLQALVQSQFFKELPSESLDAILHAGVEQRFAAGTKVIQEGEEADACYFMVQGRAAVTQKTRAIGKVNAGDAFGEISILFPGTLRTATIIAETDLMTIRIDREKFWRLLKAHLPLALEIERLGLRRMSQDKQRDT